ncbi:hypothetical protein [Salsipaludibacter albus]|uniref:hypothetical protein n=1 Tax=Salsipaludibacter albus TaxID=2849650 RepID=UPI001EE42E27|nr:hypothetical protein [Salsipaludibacter albus]MBY5164478.1 hypothetical protein [Salsipaludibacter albus]
MPTPTRGDITPTEGRGAGALPPEVLPTPPPTPPPADPTRSPELDEAVDAAVLDLVTRLDVDPTSIEVLVARPETFPDGAVGCPEPGRVVTQALVDGYRVVLVRDDRAWLYTAAEGQPPELCPSDAADGGHGWIPPPGFDE